MSPYFFVALIDNVSVVSGANVPFQNVYVCGWNITMPYPRIFLFIVTQHNGYKTPNISLWYTFVYVHCVISQRIIIGRNILPVVVLIPTKTVLMVKASYVD